MHILDELSITVIDLQPFVFHEGLLDEEQHALLIEKIELRFQIAHHLGTTTT